MHLNVPWWVRSAMGGLRWFILAHLGAFGRILFLFPPPEGEREHGRLYSTRVTAFCARAKVAPSLSLSSAALRVCDDRSAARGGGSAACGVKPSKKIRGTRISWRSRAARLSPRMRSAAEEMDLPPEN